MTIKGNLAAIPDERARTERLARCVSLSTALLDHLERAAVSARSLADEIRATGLPTPGPALNVEGALTQLRQIREIVIYEQPGLVDAYADTLRRAEADRR